MRNLDGNEKFEVKKNEISRNDDKLANNRNEPIDESVGCKMYFALIVSSKLFSFCIFNITSESSLILKSVLEKNKTYVSVLKGKVSIQDVL